MEPYERVAGVRQDIQAGTDKRSQNDTVYYERFMGRASAKASTAETRLGRFDIKQWGNQQRGTDIWATKISEGPCWLILRAEG